jgi:phosphatidylserine/phosphatidylglycerophosphate/cardiolipin synthase-like enzyme
MSKRKPSPGFRELLLALFLAIIAWSGAELFFGGTERQTVDYEPTGAVDVFFTSPQEEDAALEAGRLDQDLVAAIDAARESVDVAAFILDLEPVADALIRADRQGLRVRLVTDSDYEEARGTTMLQEAGVPVVTDNQSSLMHNKFVIIDGQTVWTGSWNLTQNGTYRNNNNVVVVRSTKLAENYTLEFEEMFVARQFGITSPDVVPHPQLDIGGARLETFFESEGDARGRIIELIEAAETSVHFMAFTFTDDDMAAAMIAQHRSGLEVKGVIEARNIADRGSDFSLLRSAGIDVRPDGNPYMMHHKVIILDGAIVVTGSYNFSLSAANINDENVLILHDAEIAARYTQEFNALFEQAAAASSTN